MQALTFLIVFTVTAVVTAVIDKSLGIHCSSLGWKRVVHKLGYVATGALLSNFL